MKRSPCSRVSHTSKIRNTPASSSNPAVCKIPPSGGSCRFRPLTGALRLCQGGSPLVDLDEAQVVSGDLLDRGVAIEARVHGIGLHRLAEDRAADRETDVALEPGGRAQPPVDLLVRGAAAQH